MSLPVSIVRDNECQRNWDSVAQRLWEPGDIKWAAYANPDPGWLVANGAAVSRLGYSELFKKIGTTWGVGDGSTTFNLPALSGRSPIAAGTGAGLTAKTLGQLVGAEDIGIADIPSHTHPRPNGNGFVTEAGAGGAIILAAGAALGVNFSGASTGAAGGGGTGGRFQPSAVLSCFIKF